MNQPDPEQVPHRGTTRLRDLDVELHLSDASRKQRFVTPMFDLIAPRYDEFTRLFSFGMDAGWKRELVRRAVASLPPGGRCVDVACGTGDLSFALAAARADAVVTGLDASARMLAMAESRRMHGHAPNVGFAAGDLSALSLPPASADAVTAGYALRNVPSWRQSLGELARVLRPSGRLFVLDFYLPDSRPWRTLFLNYLAAAGSVYGWLWHREPVAYGYIARSIGHYVTAREFSRGLEDAGFRVTTERRWLGGGVCMHEAVRERS